MPKLCIIDGQNEASFIDLKGCFARETFKEIMVSALKTCQLLCEQFKNMITDEMKRIHKQKPVNAMEEDELEFEKLQIFEAGNQQHFENLHFEEYDLAFEQLISDSDEEEGKDEKMEED